MLQCCRSRSQCRSTLMSSCNAALAGDVLFSCAHFGVWVLRPTGPRCGSLGRSPAQPDVGLGALAKHGPQGLKGRANSLARPDGASVFSWSIVPGVAPGAPLQRRPCSTPGFHSAPLRGFLHSEFGESLQSWLRPKAALVNRKPAGLRAGRRRSSPQYPLAKGTHLTKGPLGRAGRYRGTSHVAASGVRMKKR